MQPSLDEVIAVARLFNNVVIEGPPGTGKTRLVGEVAAVWERVTGRPLGGNAEGAWAMTMHPSTGYEDFIEGLRADEQRGFVVRRGFLLDRVKAALEHPDKDFLILLDELNRANVPRVLGDTLLTLERSKRAKWTSTEWVGGLGVTLPYSLTTLVLPDNLFVLATMNTTDRSIAGLDSALRRRFAFVRLPPLNSEEMLDSINGIVAEAGGDVDEAQELLRDSVEVLARVNDDLLAPILGADHVLGHSYIMLAAEEIASCAGRSSSELMALASNIRDEHGGLRRTFWVEVSAGTSEVRNQVDLSKKGKASEIGSVAYFFPGRVPISDHQVDIEWQGENYSGSELKYYDKGKKPNMTWRINLKGETQSGKKLSHFGKSHFANHVLVFIELATDSYRLISLPLTAVPALEQLGHHDSVQGASKRKYGTIDRIETETHAAPSVVRQMWQYAILPQLIDLVTSEGADGLLNANDRMDLLHARRAGADASKQAATAAQKLDDFIAGIGLRIRLDGTGLSRTLVVDRSEAPATSAVAAAASQPLAAATDGAEPATIAATQAVGESTAVASSVPDAATTAESEPADAWSGRTDTTWHT